MASRWMSLAFFVMVLYIGYSASQSSAPAPIPKAITPTITAEQYPALVEMTDVENWKRKLDPDYAARMNCTLDKPTEKNGLKFSAVEQLAGEGAGAQCGDTVTLALVVWNGAGARSFAGEVTLALGSRQVASGLDFGLLGMKVGGERLLTVPPYALVRGKATNGHEAVRKALQPDKVSVVQARRIK